MTNYILLKTDCSYKIFNFNVDSKQVDKIITGLISKHKIKLFGSKGGVVMFINTKAALKKHPHNPWLDFLNDIGFDLPYLFGDAIVGSFDIVSCQKKLRTMAKYKFKGDLLK